MIDGIPEASVKRNAPSKVELSIPPHPHFTPPDVQQSWGCIENLDVPGILACVASPLFVAAFFLLLVRHGGQAG